MGTGGGVVSAADDLDVLTRARGRLSDLVGGSEGDHPAPWRVRTQPSAIIPIHDKEGFNVGEPDAEFPPPTAHLIVALRACAPYLIDRLDVAIRDRQAVGIWQDQSAELDLARAVIEATERNDHE